MSQRLFTTTVQPVIIARSQYQGKCSDYRGKIGRLGELLERRRFMSPTYRVWVRVKEVRGNCVMGYKPGDCLVVERFYISEVGKGMHTCLKLDARHCYRPSSKGSQQR
jgi:hypothetical protein